MSCDNLVKYSNIQNKIKDVTSENSNSLARVIINENFKYLKSTTESIWCILDTIYDYTTGGLGSVGLHNDVDLTGISVGNTLVWNGVTFVASTTGGGGGGGAEFLSELLDVEDFNLPLPDNYILKYDLSENLFVPTLFSFFELAENNVAANNTKKLIYVDDNNEIQPVPLGSDGTFLFINSNTPTWSTITLDKIGDLDTSGAGTSGDYIIHFNGVDYELIPLTGATGIRNVLVTGVDIVVPEYHQYIVHQSFTLDGGTIDIEGELVIL